MHMDSCWHWQGQYLVNKWALELGGNCRTGLEDNIRYDKTRLAKSNVTR